MAGLNGFINILKPPGMLSHDVVKHMRRLFPGIKVGHGGTLDPGAAGVLPLLLGKATKFSSYLTDLPKIYRVELFLGITTDTEDSTGKIISRKKVYALPVEDLQSMLLSYQGEIEQIPPMYAAIKLKGKKLYEYARKGIVLQRPARKVQIYAIQILDYFPPERVLLEVECSKGTYMRTLCAQIGADLGYGGHMSFLLRKAVGRFVLSEAHSLEELGLAAADQNYSQVLLSLDYPFQEGEQMLLTKAEIKKLAQGQFLPRSELSDKAGNAPEAPVDEKIIPVYTTTRVFAGLARWQEHRTKGFCLKPEKIIST